MKIIINKAVISTILLFSVIWQAAFCYESTLNGYYGNNAGYFACEFDDVESGHWAAESIEYLAKYGIVSGIDGMFRPDDYITRAQYIKILITAFGLYDENASCNFVDVLPKDWYFPYVASAVNLKIASGISDFLFGPEQLVTREQMVTLAYNASKYCNISFEKNAEINFSDKEKIEDYAAEAVNLIAQSGIISGDENHMFNPKSFATRAQACKLIHLIMLRL
jgi:hypothetical protein